MTQPTETTVAETVPGTLLARLDAAERDAGDLLGELAFIDGLPRVATVTALEPVAAVVLSGHRFRSFLEHNPRVAVVLLEIVATRFRESTLKRLQFAAS